MRTLGRPIVIIEDELRGVDGMLNAFRKKVPRAMSCVTVICVAEPGPDTQGAVQRWLEDGLEVVARCRPHASTMAEGSGRRLHLLATDAVETSQAYVAECERYLRPGGMVLADIYLLPLKFLNEQTRAESIRLVKEMSGSFRERPLTLKFISQHSNFSPALVRRSRLRGDDFWEKDEIEEVAERIGEFLSQNFPWDLASTQYDDTKAGPDDLAELEENLDIIMWPARPGGVRIGGKALSRPVQLVECSSQAKLWNCLLADRLNGGMGVITSRAAQILGLDPGDPQVARDVNGIRGCFRDAGNIPDARQTGRYALRDHLQVGVAVVGQ